MAQISPKTSFAVWHQAIKIPDMTECYINSHVFTCQHCVSTMLIKILVTLLGCSLIGKIVFNSGGLGAKRNVLGKLGMKFAIKCIVLMYQCFIFTSQEY